MLLVNSFFLHRGNVSCRCSISLVFARLGGVVFAAQRMTILLLMLGLVMSDWICCCVWCVYCVVQCSWPTVLSSCDRCLCY